MRSLLLSLLLALAAILALQLAVAAERPVPDLSTLNTPINAPKVEPELLKQALAGQPHEQFRFIVELAPQANLGVESTSQSLAENRADVVRQLQSTANQSQAGLLSDLRARQAAGKVQAIRPFWVFNGIAVTADRDTLFDVAARPEVQIVRQDRSRQWLEPFSPSENHPPLGNYSDHSDYEWNIARVRAHLVWSALGIDGAGRTIAIMDTGVDWQHPALQQQYRGYKPGGLVIHDGNWACTTDEGPLAYPVDGNGHGTYVAGLAAGGRGASGQAIGMAPGARWIAVKMLDNAGHGYDSWIHAAFEWLLAPGGNPALAPDVVNGSWGMAGAADERFRLDVQALRAAGIVPVFAAGNSGPAALSLLSPASYPEAIAVGATDDQDGVASFSSRGPSPWAEVKPNLVAPGAQVQSSVPGGSYAAANGTSAAAPHVSGLVALVLQADPALSVDEAQALLASTALPLGAPVPNNVAGYGRIDAYQAVAVALDAGFIAGRVTRQPDHQPLPIAQITVADDWGQRRAVVQVDDAGQFVVALPAGTYRLTAEAFGYAPFTAPTVRVQAGATTTLDPSLPPLPGGVLWGQVRNDQTGGPVSASLSIVDTTAQTTSDPSTGQYSLVLPVGTYTLHVMQAGYRRQTFPALRILAGGSTRLDVGLQPAPTLLLVDSGRWYYGSQAGYFRQALDSRQYAYNLWEIRDLPDDLPTLDDLAPYDITIWSSPLDAPGLIGAGDTISNYLGIGGNLLLTGQDIGYWDGGLSGRISHRYYGQFLKARALDDDAGRLDIVGAPDDILAGLSLPMNDPDSAGNQRSPDLVAVLDPVQAAEIGRYAGSGTAAIRASGCQSYRAAYFAAGLEGLGDSAQRAELLDRLINWLDSPHAEVGVRLEPSQQDKVWLAGSILTYTVELLNTGQSADRFALTLSPSVWPASLWDDQFTQPITQSIALGACQTQTLGVKVEVPPGVDWNSEDTVVLTGRSQADGNRFSQALFRSKAPAPILLVDDHRWFDMLPRYRAALEARQLPYDVWRISQTPQPDLSPALQRLRRYPVIIWFTAYDWYRTLTQTDEARLAAYLEGGGRLLLSSQDYLYTNGLTEFATKYLGVAGYTDNLTATHVLGAVGSPVGQQLGPLALTYPFPNYSDGLKVRRGAPLPSDPFVQVAFWGQHAQPTALTTKLLPWKSAFFAFPLEALSADDMATVLGTTVEWLSPLGDSALVSDRASPNASGGQRLGYTLTIVNNGPLSLREVSLSNPLPALTTYVAGSLQGPAWYEASGYRVVWQGPLAAGQTLTIHYELDLDASLRAGAVVRNVAHLGDETGLTLERAAVTRVGAADLSRSVKVSSAEVAQPGQVLTYTFFLRNSGPLAAQSTLVDPAPLHTAYLPESGKASSGQITATAELMLWTGLLKAGEAVTITVPTLIGSAAAGSYVLNRADLIDGWGTSRRFGLTQEPASAQAVDLGSQTLEAYTWVEVRSYLPLILRGN